MSLAAAKIQKLPIQRDDYLGPARVVCVDPGSVDVETRDGDRRRARIALQLHYEAAIDDELLVIGRGDDWYVIGVLSASGRTHMTFQGGVTVRAEGGPLKL